MDDALCDVIGRHRYDATVHAPYALICSLIGVALRPRRPVIGPRGTRLLATRLCRYRYDIYFAKSF